MENENFYQYFANENAIKFFGCIAEEWNREFITNLTEAVQKMGGRIHDLDVYALDGKSTTFNIVFAPYEINVRVFPTPLTHKISEILLKWDGYITCGAADTAIKMLKETNINQNIEIKHKTAEKSCCILNRKYTNLYKKEWEEIWNTMCKQ